MNILFRPTTILSLTLLVLASACGGGGSSAGGGGGGVTPERLPPLPVTNTQRAISLVEGSEITSPMTSAEIEQAVRTRANAADTLISSVIVGVSGAQVERVPVTCNGIVCNVTIADGTNVYDFTTSLNDFGDTPEINGEELVGFNGRYSLVMTDRGVTLGQGIAAARFDGVSFQHRSYLGWLDNSVFTVESEEATDGTDTLALLTSYSFGNDSGSNPGGTGEAVWNGVMVGANIQRGHVVQGDARLRITDLSSATNVVVVFNNIKDLDTGADVDEINFDSVPMSEGYFRSANGDIEGSFYGDNHEEAGGVFDKDNILGAFGAIRQ